MTTHAFAAVFKGIDKLYSDHDIQLHCTPKDPANIEFASDHMKFKADVDCDFVAEKGKNDLSTFATLKIAAEGDLKLVLKDFVIYPQVSALTITNVTKISAHKSLEVDTEGFKTLANVGSGLSIEAINNRILKKGIALPAWEGISFKKAELKFQDGFLLLKVEPQFGGAKKYESEFFDRIVKNTVSGVNPFEIISDVCFNSAFEFLAKKA